MSDSDAAGSGPDTTEIACTLTEDEAERREAVERERFAPNILAIEADGEGFAFDFEPTEEAIAGVMAFVRAENRCCSFARYEIRVTVNEDPNRLWIAGPDGTKELFREGLVEPLAEEFDVPVRG